MTPTPADSPEQHLALRVIAMPRDTNIYGTIFGGIILSYIDQAGFVEARRHGVHRWVTAAIERVEFKAPVLVGDTINFMTQTIKTGRSSVQIRVDVTAERVNTRKIADVTSATITLVAVNARGEPIPFDSPPTFDIPSV
jgi:acyl-CoA thioesterase YciA